MSSKVPVDLLPIHEESPPYTTRGAYSDDFKYPPDMDRPGPSTEYIPENPDSGKNCANCSDFVDVSGIIKEFFFDHDLHIYIEEI